jgi:pyruvate dehydrogenase E1 component alpha subunit
VTKEHWFPDGERLVEMFRKMLLIRHFEENLYYRFLEGNMPGTIHQYTGQEAVAIGVCANLRRDDYVVSTHRGHGHCIAKGTSLNRLMSELLAKKTGLCRGMGGSMHLVDLEVGFLGTVGIVGAGIPIAAGAGLSAKMRETDQVTVCFFGEGAANIGAFHEGVNLAAIWELPVVFVCENNLYAVSTHVSKVMLPSDVASRAAAYSIPGVTVDGNDVIAVYKAAHEAVERAREGKGPTLLECKTYRYRGHSRFEPAGYRPEKELEEWLKKDPIHRFKAEIVKMKVLTEKNADIIKQKVLDEIEDSVKFAEASPPPEPKDVLKYVYYNRSERN